MRKHSGLTRRRGGSLARSLRMVRSWHCAHVHREVIVNGNDEEVEGVPPLVDPDRSTRPTIKGVIVNGNDEAADKTS